MKHIAIYPGTFDPLTNGHMNIIERGSSLFEKLIVGCAPTTHRKMPYLSLDERLRLLKEALNDFDNVEVLPLEGLLVDFAKKHRVNIILRGLRATSDFDYEFQLAHMNHHLSPNIETVFLPADGSYSHISGTFVREIVGLGGDVSPFLPRVITQYLRKK